MTISTSNRTPHELEKIAQASGLVNSHAHLELSDIKAPLGAPGTPITDWIPSLLAYRQARTPEDAKRAVELGLRESATSGTVTIADITQEDPPFELATKLGIRLVAFYEMIGFTAERTIESIQNAMRLLRRFPQQDETHRVGLSPHAPYTVCRKLLDAAVAISSEKNVPLAIHLAESREELQLLTDREGPFRKFLEKIPGWTPDAALIGRRPLDYLEALDHSSRLLVIHGNYLDDEELDWLAERADRATVVYCPRSHAYFGHAPYPLMKMLEKGVRVAIGTDSRASTPNLSIHEELRTVAERFPDLPVETIIELATRPLFL